MKGSELMKVTVDPDQCQGHARCWEICPEVFSLDEVGHGTVTVDEGPRRWRPRCSRR
jgi:ferredoxin